MPRTARPPRNFADDRHAVFAGWLLSRLSTSGLTIAPVNDAAGNLTPNVQITAADGSVFTLAIPYPSDDWRFTP